MRLRNVKYAKDLILEHPQIVIPNPQEHKSNWSKVFGNNHPIEVEIGCGKGKFIYESARDNPDINFIGIEKFDSVIVRALEKVIEQPISNLVLLRLDAEVLTDVFAKNEVSKIYLNFSDPWPKIRHAKRRLTSSKFLDRYSDILFKNAEIHQKTDNIELFESSIESLTEHPQFEIEQVNFDLYTSVPNNNIQTEFEVKFVEKGNSICYLKAIYIGD